MILISDTYLTPICPEALFSLPPQNFGRVIEAALWATTQVSDDLSALGLDILKDILDAALDNRSGRLSDTYLTPI